MPTFILVLLIVIAILLIVTVYLVSPRIFKKADRNPFLGHFYAHRGFHDNLSDAPENSLKAFKKAVEKGYGIELDVQLTRDEQVVVFHDNDLKRVCGIDAPVNSFTYDELLKLHICDSEEKIPLFTEVLDVIDGKVPLIVEIKMVDAKTRVCELANDILVKYDGKYMVESFHPFAVKWFREHRPKLLRGQLSCNFIKEGIKETFGMWLVHYLLTNFMCRPDFVAYSCESYNNVFFKLSKLLGALPVAWTVKSPEKLKEIKNKYKLFIFEGFEPEKYL